MHHILSQCVYLGDLDATANTDYEMTAKGQCLSGARGGVYLKEQQYDVEHCQIVGDGDCDGTLGHQGEVWLLRGKAQCQNGRGSLRECCTPYHVRLEIWQLQAWEAGKAPLCVVHTMQREAQQARLTMSLGNGNCMLSIEPL